MTFINNADYLRDLTILKIFPISLFRTFNVAAHCTNVKERPERRHFYASHCLLLMLLLTLMATKMFWLMD